ncbi:MAG: DNA-directed RNA polymerase subunit beta' [Actinomycetaceae bacterium]|nr:DNA-directed RNA polymerase subunit beta' [Actinomycetaceae bacterium]MDY6082822.1 DNA-directed RNA polymerase subunit beta' [Actinomycetaceae bacterium]
MLDVNRFDSLHISLATTEDIHRWSYGEVKKPETINYRTLKPEKDGLFGEQIFGPTRDWECACGKYKRPRFKGIICERCGVEVTRSKVRRERMGHIELAAPVTHIWYFKGVPSRLGYLLDIAPKDLEKVIYFAAYMVTRVDEEARTRDMASLTNEYEVERKAMEDDRDAHIAQLQTKLEQQIAQLEADGKTAEVAKARKSGESEIARARRSADSQVEMLDTVWDRFVHLHVGDLEGSEEIYREMDARYSDYFDASRGAEAVQKRLQDFDLEAEHAMLVDQIENGTAQKKIRALKRIKVVNAFRHSGTRPEVMVLNAIPVIPPDLRPMIQLDGGRFATSDLNDLYRRVINRNNRLKRMLDLGAPEIMVNNEKRMLQEAVDALFDNGRRGRPVAGASGRPLKSLADMLKGKQGRFRQNLLGKRVDYSGRSVIVVGPSLKMHQCGVPKTMALELFKPFVQKRLVDLQIAKNVKAAKRMVDRQRPEVWDVLEEVISEHPVLLNRAPTLHRLGIQAFEPVLIEGKAIQLHPLACAAFNADFDGDQMAIHIPLSVEAQAEARILMLASNNILKPSDGHTVTMPSQDMVIGIFGLTREKKDVAGTGRYFGSVAEAQMAYDLGELDIDAMCHIRFEPDLVPPVDWEPPVNYEQGDPIMLETSLGRAIFNRALPQTFPYVNRMVDKKALGKIVDELSMNYDKANITASLDALKNTGFYYAGRVGVTIAASDVILPPDKQAILDEADKRAARIERQYETGRIGDEDRRRNLADHWEKITEEVRASMQKNLDGENNVNEIVSSGARGNWDQFGQIAGMRGLVADPKGNTIPYPIKSSYREGLSVLEYFISTHGARKGLADTALRTADSGYLTRRLVDVAQDVIVREDDCGTRLGLTKPIAVPGEDGSLVPASNLGTTVYARTLARDAVDAQGNVVIPAGTDLNPHNVAAAIDAGITELMVRSVLTCESHTGVCAACYGRSMATGHRVDIGEAVGIVAAQSIGEPGTQLTMRTFHNGGSASSSGDIVGGLPRVQELFEARKTPKGEAPIAEASGTMHIDDDGERVRHLVLTRDDGGEDLSYPVSKRVKLRFEEGEHVEAGVQLTEGSVDPTKVLRISGMRRAQQLIVDQVQSVYNSQSVEIHDKHIEVIVRQMTRRVTVLDSGTTSLLPGELVDSMSLRDESRAALAEGGKPASGRPELMGITKTSLATDSWLSAASFQETTRVLTEAALNAKSDPLFGLKENVMLGKLIPAGTGLEEQHKRKVEPTDEARVEFEKNNGYAHQDFDPYDESYEYDDYRNFDLSAGYGF